MRNKGQTKQTAEATTAAETVKEEAKLEQSKKSDVVDEKKSFVDQVSEGLMQKVSADRFTNEEDVAPVTAEEVKDEEEKVENEPKADAETKEEAKPESKEDDREEEDKKSEEDAPK